MPSKKQVGWYSRIDTRTKVLAVICGVAESLFLGSVAILPSGDKLYALITCAVVLVVLIVGIILIEFRELGSHDLEPAAETIDDARQSAITGTWRGKVRQRTGFGVKSFQQMIEIKLIAEGNAITGEFIDKFNDGTKDQEWPTTVIGEFFYASFLKVHYRVNDRNIMQFGTMLLELNKNGRALDGKFVGFGATSGKVITGTINLLKD
jgi:hypothetical protein